MDKHNDNRNANTTGKTASQPAGEQRKETRAAAPGAQQTGNREQGKQAQSDNKASPKS